MNKERRRTEVVRNNNHTALEFLDRGGKRVDRGHIQVVRGFI